MPKTDPELSAMNKIAAALAPLDDATKERVLNWAWSKYVAPIHEERARQTTKALRDTIGVMKMANAEPQGSA